MHLGRALRTTALAAALAVPGAIVAGAPAAQATARSCHWADKGDSGVVRVQDGNGSQLTAGRIHQQFDYCGNSRARFVWDGWFRTHAHPGITGAWVQVLDLGDDGRGRDSGEYGSLSGPEVTTNPISVHSWGDNEWYGVANMRITHGNGSTARCTAYSSTWDYHYGRPTEGAQPGTCGY
ncbi:hypothetical protein [Streptomyces orinoci]|uniref:Secreted protein n=1 Tax=Streptomyces orinoci TaxID=67339 RepID=A0ABV3JZU3_STRON|nr:hypothetical protein [Streptomyces orinoci]